MSNSEDGLPSFRWQSDVDEPKARFYRHLEFGALICAVIATVVRHGLLRSTRVESGALGLIVLVCAFIIAAAYGKRYQLSLRKVSFLKETWSQVGFSIFWMAAFLGILVFGPLLPEVPRQFSLRVAWWFYAAEILAMVLATVQLASGTRALASRGWNPALLLVGTFVALILTGTLLLMLPRARADYVAGNVDEGAPLLTALFTSTSASCVTGLVVEHTGHYWSRFGQVIILFLIQMGGLGIMTCGALFVALTAKPLQLQETATLRTLLDSDKFTDVRRLLATILFFTLSAEVIGAILISGLWADLPWGERAFQSLFHSVSAFCNAGFSLTPDSLVGWGNRWQVWFGICALIITGGLGFGVVHNISRVIRKRFCAKRNDDVEAFLVSDRRLSMTSRLVLVTTFILLVGGTGIYHLLESLHVESSERPVSWYDAWFQSVTFRTAGFNTVDLGQAQTTTKLFGIAMMFIGASPGSTGGGVKTVCISVILLSIVSLLRGKDRVELGHRRIPDFQMQRAFLIVTLGVAIVLVTTFLLVLFENKPELFVDHMFESTSAFATVGLSTGITDDLTPPSRVVIIVVMLIGRVGPLTLVLALAGRANGSNYELPTEKVALG